MNIDQRIKEFRKTFGGVVTMVLVPVRAPYALVEFGWRTISHWWEERSAKRGVTLDVMSIRRRSEPFLPDPRQHH